MLLRTPERFVAFSFFGSLIVTVLLGWFGDHTRGWPYQIVESAGLDRPLLFIPAIQSNLEIFAGNFDRTEYSFLLDAYLINFLWLLYLLLLLKWKEAEFILEMRKRFQDPEYHGPNAIEVDRSKIRRMGVQGPSDIARFMSLFLLLGAAGLFDVFEDSRTLPGNQIVVDPWSAIRFFVFDGFIMLGITYVYPSLKVHFSKTKR